MKKLLILNIILITLLSYIYYLSVDSLTSDNQSLRQALTKQEIEVSHVQYLKHTDAVAYTRHIKDLEQELADTHLTYQENIAKLEVLSGDELKRREGMVKVIYSGCLISTPDPVYCAKIAFGFYEREGWLEVDDRAYGWQDLWPLILGTVRG